MKHLETANQLNFFIFEWLGQFSEVKHFISTRKAGVSKGNYQSLNVALHVGDAEEDVRANRQLLATDLNLEPQNFRLAKQVHGNTVLLAEQLPQDAWQLSPEQLPEADALITQSRNLCLTVLTADCVPILFFDPITQAIGIAHAGWKGTVQKIGLATVRAMQKNFGTKPENVWVGLGPAITPEVYEVGEEVEDAIALAFDTTKGYILEYAAKPNKKYLDLWQANIRPLVNYGIPEKQIECSHLCSFQDKENFFSARRDGNESGRMASGIYLV